MQTSLQLHLLKSYSNLQKSLLYSPYFLRDQIQLICYWKMHTKMHLPHSLVTNLPPFIIYQDLPRQKYNFFPAQWKSFKNTASHFSTFLPFSASKFPQKQIYSFSKMNLKDVHIKKIKPTKVQRPEKKKMLLLWQSDLLLVQSPENYQCPFSISLLRLSKFIRFQSHHL